MLIVVQPPDPSHIRVKVAQQLARMGAVPLKDKVYVLPRLDRTLRDLLDIKRVIDAHSGDASVVTAEVIDGLSEAELSELFKTARNADYQFVLEQAHALAKQARGKSSIGTRLELEAEVAGLEARLKELAELDFFGASGRASAAMAVRGLRERLAAQESDAPVQQLPSRAYRGRTWVTRSGINLERIACAWLIARFIDTDAKFRFVSGKTHVPRIGELRFDMPDAEYRREGDLCTFEVLCSRLGLDAPGLRPVAEVIHDIVVQDEKYQRSETWGVAAQITGITLLHRKDEARLQHGSQLLEQLLAYFVRSGSAERSGNPLSKTGRRAKPSLTPGRSSSAAAFGRKLQSPR